MHFAKLLFRWLLAMPSPSQLACGPDHYDAATRRYVRLRQAGKIDRAFGDADFWLPAERI